MPLTEKLMMIGGALDGLDLKGYCKTVGRLLAKLVLLVAVLLMPVGMSGAAAAQTTHHAPRAMMTMGDCPESAPGHHEKSGIAECTMACSGALPAVGSAHHSSPMTREELIQPTTARQLVGLHPETATPPPKVS